MKGKEKLALDICFAKHSGSCELEIVFDGDQSRELVAGLNTEINNRLAPHKTSNSVFDSFWTVFGPILVGSLGFSLIVTSFSAETPDSRKKLMLTIGITLSGIAVGLAVIRLFKPYTMFETIKNSTQERRVNWVILGLIGFILFTVIGVYLRKSIFGFWCLYILPLA